MIPLPSVGYRPDWDWYFLNIALAVAYRADCSRRQVGAVLVKDNRIKSTGYNGAPSGGPSCLKGECPRGQSDVEPGSSYDTGAGACIAVHAEANALLYASREDCEGATLYVTAEPCDGCARLIVGSGIARVVYYMPSSPFAPVPPGVLVAKAGRLVVEGSPEHKGKIALCKDHKPCDLKPCQDNSCSGVWEYL